jgi:hypothetical protein
MDGKIISEKTVNNLQGQQVIPISLVGLATGNYMVSVTTNEQSFVKILSVK